MATIKDVAALAGVTPTTVSRCINNRGYIKDETKAKIHKAMEELGYRPNGVARALSKQTTDTIAVIVPHITHPYFATLISKLEQSANAHGFKMFLMSSREDDARKESYLKMSLDSRVSGIIVCSEEIESEKLQKYGTPVVEIETHANPNTPHIICDNKEGGRLAAKALIDAGCRNLLHIGGIEDSHVPADDRALGFREVCETSNVKHSEVSYSSRVYSSLDYMKYIEEILSKFPDTDGIFASSDLIAAQVCQVARRTGRIIPGDLKLIGFDGVYISEMATPSITTIKQPLSEMAEAAVSIIDAIQNNQPYESEHVFPVRLIRRETL